MKMDEILAQVPDYDCFYTVEEMNERSRALAKQYPDVVELFDAGISQRGNLLLGIKIGNGSQNALVYGSQHPNEPIGCMMLDTLLEQLASNEALRKELDYTWYVIKSADIDGTILNEGWFKGPFTATHYQKNFYRPSFHQQVEWSFPVDYKTYHFNQPIPETQAIMHLIDQIHPTFIYSLHNSSFGGVYWYLTDGDEELFAKLHQVPQKYNLGIQAGEPETPFCVELAPAIYRMINLRDNYDYLEKYSNGEDPATKIQSGGCSDDYANEDGKIHSHIFVNELPYFYDKRVSDASLTEMTRKEALLKSCDITEEYAKRWCEIAEGLVGIMSETNPFYLAFKERLQWKTNNEAKREWALSNPEFENLATVSQVFDSLVSTKWYANLHACLVWRSCAYELSHNPSLTKEEIETIQEAEKKLEKVVDLGLEEIEKELDYKAIPISDLVKIQLECGLHYAMYAHEKAKGDQ